MEELELHERDCLGEMRLPTLMDTVIKDGINGLCDVRIKTSTMALLVSDYDFLVGVAKRRNIF